MFNFLMFWASGLQESIALQGMANGLRESVACVNRFADDGPFCVESYTVLLIPYR